MNLNRRTTKSIPSVDGWRERKDGPDKRTTIMT